MVERGPEKAGVGSSILLLGTIYCASADSGFRRNPESDAAIKKRGSRDLSFFITAGCFLKGNIYCMARLIEV